MENKISVIASPNEKFAYTLLTAFLWIGALCAGYFFKTAYLALDVLLFGGLAVFYWRKPQLFRKLSLWHGLLGAFICLYWLSCLYAVDLGAE